MCGNLHWSNHAFDTEFYDLSSFGRLQGAQLKQLRDTHIYKVVEIDRAFFKGKPRKAHDLKNFFKTLGRTPFIIGKRPTVDTDYLDDLIIKPLTDNQEP